MLSAAHTAGDAVQQLAWDIRKHNDAYGVRREAKARCQDKLRAWLQQLQPTQEQQVLEAALLRGHVVFVQAAGACLSWRPSPAAVGGALRHHIAAGHTETVQRVAQCESAQQLSVQQVLELLHAAVQEQPRHLQHQQHQHQHWPSYLPPAPPHAKESLFSLPAARQLSTAQLSELLTAACELQNTVAVRLLAVNASAASQLSGAAPALMLGWLQTAVQLGDSQAVEALCATSGADELKADAVAALLWPAIEQQDTAAAAVLLEYTVRRHTQEQQYQQQQVQHNSEQQQQQRQHSLWLDAASVSAFLEAAIKRKCCSRFTVI
ncbi:hypothetical protein COO60DRAFT_856407 [Scenedesmus sp. NREL 46B-D3]|nr:hypothetical protein COO60DRAFT_856407 [Scenedesmus sp. NREL 46B-D3]